MIKLIIGTAFLLIMAFSNGAICAEKEIVIGDWTISPREFSWSHEPRWVGSATRADGNTIQIEIYIGTKREAGRQITRPLEVEELGTIKFAVYVYSLPMQQVSPPLQVIRQFMFDNEKQCIILSYSKQVRNVPDAQIPALQEEELKKAAIEAPNDPAIHLLKDMLKQQVELGRYVVATECPKLKASVDGNNFVALKQSSIAKQWNASWRPDCSWYVNAHPSQHVIFETEIDGHCYLVGTITSQELKGEKAFAGMKVLISSKEGIVDSNGVAAIEYGVIENPHKLTLSFRGWKETSRDFHGNIFLRWGRPEEEWLDSCNFPLAAQVTVPTVDNCINNILHDLENAYDADLDAWAVKRGACDVYKPNIADIAAMRGLDLKNYRRLSSLQMEDSTAGWFEHFFEVWWWEKTQHNSTVSKNAPPQELAARIIDSVDSATYTRVLWVDISDPRKDGLSGWHSPQPVYGLTVLWNRFPKLRSKNPLEKILDYWVKAIQKRPQPVHFYGKMAVEVDPSMIQLGYAIAAMHNGYKHFKKPEYLQARNTLLSRMRDAYNENGMLGAMENKIAWSRTRVSGVSDATLLEMCVAVSIYGQTCVFLEDEKGLRTAQGWVLAALAREGQEGKNPFHNYESATFADRCGMLAVMRKTTAYLTPLEE